MTLKIKGICNVANVCWQEAWLQTHPVQDRCVVVYGCAPSYLDPLVRDADFPGSP